MQTTNMTKPIYLDYNATTPIAPQVVEAMLPYLYQDFGNPSSSHVYGVRAKMAVDQARTQVAELLGSAEDEILFTSGGSESNNHAILGVAYARRDRGKHIITSAIEHPAVTEVCRALEHEGYHITYLPVDASGIIDLGMLQKSLSSQTILVTIMHANNEVGVIQPIAEIAELAHRAGALMHSDCAQSVGKIPVRVDELGVDLLTVAGHKIYAPKGIGCLYIRKGVSLNKLIHGASHERGLRAGTENVPSIVGLGEACAMIGQDLPIHQDKLRELRDLLERGLCERCDIRIHAQDAPRLPNTSSIGFRNLSNLLPKLHPKIAASAGAACHGSGGVSISNTLQAMDVPHEYAIGTIRFSVGRYTTQQEIEQAIEITSQIVAQSHLTTD